MPILIAVCRPAQAVPAQDGVDAVHGAAQRGAAAVRRGATDPHGPQ